MAPRTSWKGYIKLSLVSVPVKAFTANNTSEEIRLNQLHQDCHQRVKYQKVCPEHGELSSRRTSSAGTSSPRTQYVDHRARRRSSKLRPESDKADQDPRLRRGPEDDRPDLLQAGKTYFLLPDGMAGEKPYALLHEGMNDAGVVGYREHRDRRAVSSS